MKPLSKQAIDILQNIAAWEDAYNEVNKTFKAHDPSDDFCTRIQHMPAVLEDKIIKLLDTILPHGIASYWLYEVRNMKNGGCCIEIDGVEYKIKTITDVKNFVGAMES